MIRDMVGAVYRGTMAAAAAMVAGAATVPGAPASWRRGRDRLGRLSAAARAAVSRGPVLWFHAASVGELRAVRPLLGALRTQRAGRVVLATTLTRTGLALARELPEVDVAALLPLDAPGAVNALLEGLALEAFCFTETEIWPTVLAAVAARGAPAFMVSGRLSARTAARAPWLRPLYAPALARVACCMQSADDAARVVALGADPARVHVTGSLKFEHAASDPPDSVGALGARLGDRPLLVAGSTHEGEETMVLEAYDRVVAQHRGLLLLLAPRHPERLDGVAAAVQRHRALVSYRALTAGDEGLPAGPAVVLLDVMGPLAHCYALGVAGFVGGSLVPVGGHNVLEPARVGRPVLVGPHTASVDEVVTRLVAAGGARRVRSPEELADAVGALLADPEAASEMGRRARAAIAAGEGALARHLAVILARLGPAPVRAATG